MRIAESAALNGYGSETYAQTLTHIGTPIWCAESQMFALRRPIPHSELEDLMGLYPMIRPLNWNALMADLAKLSDEFVSFVGVSDPMRCTDWHEIERENLRCTAYKQHYVADLSTYLSEPQSSTTVRNVEFARQACQVREVDPTAGVHAFHELYQSLKSKTGTLGSADFSLGQLCKQSEIPGTRLFVALNESAAIGAIWVFVEGETAYFHLAAYNQAGYDARAGYALMHHAYQSLVSDGIRYAHLGGVPGEFGDEQNPLAEFKRRWSTETRTAFLIQVILKPEIYAQLSEGATTPFFPAYRGRCS